MCAPQIPHKLTWYLTSASAMADWLLTASAVKGKIASICNVKEYVGNGGKGPLILLLGTMEMSA
jgi:hypothetical protein